MGEITLEHPEHIRYDRMELESLVKRLDLILKLAEDVLKIW